MISRKYHPFILILLPLLALFSCNKDKIDENPALKLEFSTDTVFFDTVFTTVGTVTQRLLVYNRNKSKINISSIELAGGTGSNFKLNIDGTSASTLNNVELQPNDSLFIFVKATIDPNNQSTPFIVADSIRFMTNGNYQDVKLVAWGQDAYFYKEANLTGINDWDTLKPRIIYGYLRVDTAASLILQAGCKVYLHKNAYLAISKDASFKVNGTLEHPVHFLGDRLDPFYRDLPGQWKGIYIERGSKNNEINYAIIKNGNFGITVDSISPPEPILKLNNTIIQNVTSNALYLYASKVISTNCVFGGCGGTALYIDFGGDYDFRHLTIGNYWSASVRNTPSLVISNYQFDGSGGKISNPLSNAYFGNCIIYGNIDEELRLDSLAGITFNYTFDHAILKTKTTGGSKFIDCLYNKDPLFVDYNNDNYSIDTLSPAIGKGTPLGVALDIKGISRGNPPDLGAYQFVPGR